MSVLHLIAIAAIPLGIAYALHVLALTVAENWEAIRAALRGDHRP
jgi:hypothetical protein